MDPDDHFGRVEAPARDLVRFVFEEAKGHVQHQVTVVRDMEQKAGEVLRFDALTGGLVVATLSVLLGRDGAVAPLEVLVLFGAASFLLVGSMALAALAFRQSNTVDSLNAAALEQGLDPGVDPRVFREDAVFAYLSGARYNHAYVIEPTSRSLSASLGLLVGTVACLAASAVVLIGAVVHG